MLVHVSLGDWEQGYYKDEFGDNTDTKLVYRMVKLVLQPKKRKRLFGYTTEIYADAVLEKKADAVNHLTYGVFG